DDPVVGLDEVLAKPHRPSTRTIRRLGSHEDLLPSCRRSLCCIIFSPPVPFHPPFRPPPLRPILRKPDKPGSRGRPPMVRWFAAFALIFILSMVLPPGSNTAFGQDAYPTRPVKFLVPYPGGGTNDVLARIVGDKLQAKWGQPVIIENR